MTSELERGSDEWRRFVRVQTRVLQIIVGALIFGVFVFAVVIVAIGPAGPPRGRILTSTAVAIATAMVVLHVIVPMIVERAALANRSIGSGPRGLLGALTARTIVACALLEGAAFFSIVAMMIEHHRWVLGVTAVLVMLMAMQFPTTTRVEQWLETRLMEEDVTPR